jgi:hypothetical protein
MSALRISAVTVTPVAFSDPPLLNSVGVHEPFALRAVVEVSTDGGLSGLGETYADERHLAALRAAADAIVGADAYHTEQIYRRVQAIAAPDTPIASGLIGDSSATDRAFAPPAPGHPGGACSGTQPAPQPSRVAHIPRSKLSACPAVTTTMSHHRGQDQHDVTSPWLPSRATWIGVVREWLGVAVGRVPRSVREVRTVSGPGRRCRRGRRRR